MQRLAPLALAMLVACGSTRATPRGTASTANHTTAENRPEPVLAEETEPASTEAPPVTTCVAPSATAAVRCEPTDPPSGRSPVQVRAAFDTYIDARLAETRRRRAPVTDAMTPELAQLARDLHACRCAATGADRATFAFAEGRLYYDVEDLPIASLLFEAALRDDEADPDYAEIAADLALDTTNRLRMAGAPGCEARMRELIVEARRRVCHEGGAPHDAEPCERYDAIETDLQRLGL